MKIQQLDPGAKLPLTNAGQLQIFWIGVGSAFAKTHYQSNLLIVKGEDHIMVDFGALAPHALLKTARLTPIELKTFLPTHSHADHIGGLEEVALTHRYGSVIKGGKRPVCIINEAYQEILWDRSLRGGLEWNEQDNKGRRATFSEYFDISRPIWKQDQPREIWDVQHGSIKLELFRTRHTPDNALGWQDSFVSFGLFIDGHVFISGDTQFDLELIEHYAPKSSVMFHDVQFFPGAVHAPLQDLKTLPEAVKAKMHLYHYADNYVNQDITGFAGWTQQGVIYEP